MTNTLLIYTYKDVYGTYETKKLILEGALTDKQVLEMFDVTVSVPPNGFIPEDVGLENLQYKFKEIYGDKSQNIEDYKAQLDAENTFPKHTWHILEQIENTDKISTSIWTMQEVYDRFRQTKGKWSVKEAFDRLLQLGMY